MKQTVSPIITAHAFVNLLASIAATMESALAASSPPVGLPAVGSRIQELHRRAIPSYASVRASNDKAGVPDATVFIASFYRARCRIPCFVISWHEHAPELC